MGLRDMARYQQWREQRAAELIGPYAVKTAGAFVSTPQRRSADGWLYGGRDAMCFFADNPVELAYLNPPGQVDQRTLVISYQDCDDPQLHSIPGAPNLILDFGGGREFVGAQDRMQQLLRLWHMWRGGGQGADLWDATADVAGLPLYQRASRIPSRPGATLVGFLLGLLAAIYVIWGAATENPGSTFVNVTWPADALVAAFYLAILTLIGWWLPNVIAGLVIAAVPGSLVAAIVLFAKGYPAGGWMFLGMAIGLVLVRVISAKLAGRRLDRQYSYFQ